LAGQGEIFIKILKLADNGLTNTKIQERLSLSRQQVRRYTAELVDKGLLRNYQSNGEYMLTAKGNIFLKRNSNYSDRFLLDAYDLSREIISLNPNDTLLDARNFMLRYNISRIVISENRKPIGIITEKDISKYLYETLTEKKLSEVLIKEVMNKKLITIAINSELKNCTSLMLKNNLSSLVLVDDTGVQKGIITKTDLVELYGYHYGNKYPSKEWMTSEVQTIEPFESIHMILLLMNIHNISRIIVVKNYKPLGIVTNRDLLPVSFLFQHKYPDSISPTNKLSFRKQRYIPTRINSILLAKDVMNDPITILSEADLAEAAKIMIRNGISGLPIVNSKNKLVGIITKTDIVKALDKILNKL
jgi:CBS domain-containing protein/predicted transcriptional regulator